MNKRKDVEALMNISCKNQFQESLWLLTERRHCYWKPTKVYVFNHTGVYYLVFCASEWRLCWLNNNCFNCTFICDFDYFLYLNGYLNEALSIYWYLLIFNFDSVSWRLFFFKGFFPNCFPCSFPESEHNTMTNYTTGRHILHRTPRKMIVISYYYVQLWMLSILVYHHMGTLHKCQIDPSKFIAMGHFLTGGHHLYSMCMYTHHSVCHDLKTTTIIHSLFIDAIRCTK